MIRRFVIERKGGIGFTAANIGALIGNEAVRQMRTRICFVAIMLRRYITASVQDFPASAIKEHSETG